jgi:hypothetical protein
MAAQRRLLQREIDPRISPAVATTAVQPRAQPVPFGRAWMRPVETVAAGRTTCGYLITGKQGRGRPAVVGIAGAFRPSSALFGPVRALCDGFDFLLVDMPGFNGTGPAIRPSVDTFADHVLDLAAAELGDRAILLLGESFGGIIALSVAARLGPGRVSGIALIDPPLSQPALGKARAYLRQVTGEGVPNAFLAEFLDGDGIIRDADPDGYLGLVRDVQDWARILTLAGGRTDGNTLAAPHALMDPVDELTVRASDPPELASLRFAEAGHQVLSEAGAASVAALRRFYESCSEADIVPLRAAADALARAPSDADRRARLLVALRRCLAQSRRGERDCLLPLLRARPDDFELFNEILRVLYAHLDAEGMAAVRTVAERARDPEAVRWARLHIASTLSGMGDIDGAVAEIRSVEFGDPLPPRIATLLLNLELYTTDADDRRIARAKEACLRNIRRLAPAIGAAPRPRVGFVSGCFASRNYLSLLVPFLQELADSELDIELLSLTSDRLDHLRVKLPARISVHELGVLAPDTGDSPAAWSAASRALAARQIGLLVDLDDSLVPWSPGCVADRPARVQATWFNMTGPSLDRCYDAAIGPETLYPQALDTDFPGRVARLPGDLYVYAPEIWASGPGAAMQPDIGPPPMLRNGYPTFGSLSNLYKISDACIALWAKVLHAIPDARFELGNAMAHEPLAVARVTSAFQHQGIDPSRIAIRCFSGWPNYLAGYSRIDVALATYPVAGGTTLFEAVHLGMPVLSRVGATSLGRIGRWIEAAVGRPGMAHDNDDSFVAAAKRLVSSPDELARLRRDEPARLRAKSALDARRMAVAFERIARGLLAER